MGHNDLGEFYYHLGDLPSALKSFAQARDYCTTDKHSTEMCLNVIKVCFSIIQLNLNISKKFELFQVALHLRNYTHVTNYVIKLNQLLNPQSDNVYVLRLCVRSDPMLHLQTQVQGRSRIWSDCFT